MVPRLNAPFWLQTLLTVCLLLACSDPRPPDADVDAKTEAPAGPVLVSTWPLTGLTSSLLDPEIPVQCLLTAGEDPAHWSPDAEDLAHLTRARAVLINGAGLESWLISANLPHSRVIDVSVGFTDSWIEYKGELQHSHGSRGAHDHVGHDPHIWMDPLLALQQARSLQTQAVERGWISEQTGTQRAAALELQLRELDSLWARVAKALGDRSLLANHDAYAYPARRHGLVIHVVDVDPGERPEQLFMAAMQTAIFRHTPRLMLFEAEPNPALRTYLKDDLQLLPFVLSPSEAPSERGYIESMRSDLNRLLEILEPTTQR